MELSQATRQLRVETELGPEVLLLVGFSGTESISTPFMFQVDLESRDPSIDAEALLRTPITLFVTLDDGSERKIHGRIARVMQFGQQDDITSYRVEMVPWLWFLSLNRECRIFQQKTVPEIVEQVLGDRGHSGDYELHCEGEYPTVEYCVQYRESDLAFIQRLLEQEGIFYFFRHDDDKEVMVIADGNSIFEDSPHQPSLRYRAQPNLGEEVVTSFQREHSVYVGKVTLRDYDPLQPTIDVSASLSGDEQQEYYDYPGAYAKIFCNDAGNVAGEGERYARLRLELHEGRRHRSAGQGNCRGILVGHKFALEEHYRDDANAEYVVTSLSHVARGGHYRSRGEGDVDYRCSFTVIDPTRPYRPELRTVKPVVEGSQTAVVVGPSGEEVFTDKYGRVKCQFHWDREGQKDEHSSCWIRVAMPWAGKGYGSVSIPRIGNEVVVQFLEGDPDQPLIVGSVYNDDQSPPNALPDSGIQMGMKSRSSKGGGGYNEISMTDTAGSEAITIHGQYDMNTTVENDMTETVNNNRTTSIAVDDTESVGGNQSLQVQGDRSTVVEGSHTESVTGDQTVSVEGDQKTTVSGNQESSVTGDRSASITGTDSAEALGDMSRKSSANVIIEALAQMGIKATGPANVESAAMITVKSPLVQIGDQVINIEGQMIVLSAGGSSIAISPAGITMSGPTINSAASAMNKITGGVVMIN